MSAERGGFIIAYSQDCLTLEPWFSVSQDLEGGQCVDTVPHAREPILPPQQGRGGRGLYVLVSPCIAPHLQEILGSTSYLLSSGEELEQLPYADQNTLQPLMGKIKQLVTDFDSRLSKRKKKLDDSVRLHRLTAAVSRWGTLCLRPPKAHS